MVRTRKSDEEVGERKVRKQNRECVQFKGDGGVGFAHGLLVVETDWRRLWCVGTLE